VDELIPCAVRPWYERKAKPLFAKVEAPGHAVFTLMLEKAFAKMRGSYQALAGGTCAWAWRAITGSLVQHRFTKSGADSWQPLTTNRDFKADKPFDVSSVSFRSFASELSQNEGLQSGSVTFADLSYWRCGAPRAGQEFFSEMVRFVQEGSLVCASTASKGDRSRPRPDGIVDNHVYTVLKACTSKLPSSKGLRVLRLRNPHGTGKWKGRWSNGSIEWQQSPGVLDELAHQFSDDGCFCMDWNDFQAIFKDVQVCPIDRSYA